MSNKTGITSLSFNQDFNCFACCTEVGLRIYNADPTILKERYDFGGISQCAMLFRSNFFLVAAGGQYPKFSRNIVFLYECVSKKFVLELNFSSPVKTIRLSKSKIFVSTEKQISVFGYSNLIEPEHLLNIDTRPNSKGLFEISPLESFHKQFLIYPGTKIGSINIMDISNLNATSSTAPRILNAHQGEISCLAINRLGSLVASASAKGTLIRIWDTNTKTKVVELRRGSDTATLYCLNFSPNAEFLCCSSDKGTVHIFALKDATLNRKSSLQPLSFVSSYVDSQWALATFTVPPELPCICAFMTADTVMAICLDGTFHKYTFNKAGICVRKGYHVFLNNCDEEEI